MLKTKTTMDPLSAGAAVAGLWSSYGTISAMLNKTLGDYAAKYYKTKAHQSKQWYAKGTLDMVDLVETVVREESELLMGYGVMRTRAVKKTTPYMKPVRDALMNEAKLDTKLQEKLKEHFTKVDALYSKLAHALANSLTCRPNVDGELFMTMQQTRRRLALNYREALFFNNRIDGSKNAIMQALEGEESAFSIVGGHLMHPEHDSPFRLTHLVLTSCKRDGKENVVNTVVQKLSAGLPAAFFSVQFQEDTDTGIVLRQEGKQLTVFEVKAGSYADKKGVRSGMVVAQVNGRAAPVSAIDITDTWLLDAADPQNGYITVTFEIPAAARMLDNPTFKAKGLSAWQFSDLAVPASQADIATRGGDTRFAATTSHTKMIRNIKRAPFNTGRFSQRTPDKRMARIMFDGAFYTPIKSQNWKTDNGFWERGLFGRDEGPWSPKHTEPVFQFRKSLTDQQKYLIDFAYLGYQEMVESNSTDTNTLTINGVSVKFDPPEEWLAVKKRWQKHLIRVAILMKFFPQTQLRFKESQCFTTGHMSAYDCIPGVKISAIRYPKWWNAVAGLKKAAVKTGAGLVYAANAAGATKATSKQSAVTRMRQDELRAAGQKNKSLLAVIALITNDLNQRINDIDAYADILSGANNWTDSMRNQSIAGAKFKGLTLKFLKPDQGVSPADWQAFLDRDPRMKIAVDMMDFLAYIWRLLDSTIPEKDYIEFARDCAHGDYLNSPVPCGIRMPRPSNDQILMPVLERPYYHTESTEQTIEQSCNMTIYSAKHSKEHNYSYDIVDFARKRGKEELGLKLKDQGLNATADVINAYSKMANTDVSEDLQNLFKHGLKVPTVEHPYFHIVTNVPVYKEVPYEEVGEFASGSTSLDAQQALAKLIALRSKLGLSCDDPQQIRKTMDPATFMTACDVIVSLPVLHWTRASIATLANEINKFSEYRNEETQLWLLGCHDVAPEIDKPNDNGNLTYVDENMCVTPGKSENIIGKSVFWKNDFETKIGAELRKQLKIDVLNDVVSAVTGALNVRPEVARWLIDIDDGGWNAKRTRCAEEIVDELLKVVRETTAFANEMWSGVDLNLGPSLQVAYKLPRRNDWKRSWHNFALYDFLLKRHLVVEAGEQYLSSTNIIAFDGSEGEYFREFYSTLMVLWHSCGSNPADLRVETIMERIQTVENKRLIHQEFLKNDTMLTREEVKFFWVYAQKLGASERELMAQLGQEFVMNPCIDESCANKVAGQFADIVDLDAEAPIMGWHTLENRLVDLSDFATALPLDVSEMSTMVPIVVLKLFNDNGAILARMPERTTVQIKSVIDRATPKQLLDVSMRIIFADNAMVAEEGPWNQPVLMRSPSDDVKSFVRTMVGCISQVQECKAVTSALAYYFFLTDNGGLQLKNWSNIFTGKSDVDMAGTGRWFRLPAVDDVFAAGILGITDGGRTGKDFLESKMNKADAATAGLVDAVTLLMTTFAAHSSLASEVENTWWRQAHSVTAHDGTTALFKTAYKVSQGSYDG